MSEDITGWVITSEDAGSRLDKFLTREMNLSRTKVQKLCESGFVLLNDQPGSSNSILKVNDVIRALSYVEEVKEPFPENIPLDIVYEDEFIILVNKPAGMMVHSNNHIERGTLVNALLFYLGSLPNTGHVERPGIVHRLDKDTSGVMVVAKSVEAYHLLVEMFKNRQVEKEYLALVIGEVAEEEGVIDLPLDRVGELSKMQVVANGGKESVTFFKRLKAFKGYSLVSASPKTGRTHQIRVHLKAKGYPLVCDTLYSNDHQKYCVVREIGGESKKVSLLERQALHAHKIRFIHPIQQVEVVGEAPLAQDISSVLIALENGEKRIF